MIDDVVMQNILVTTDSSLAHEMKLDTAAKPFNQDSLKSGHLDKQDTLHCTPICE